jgi:hypothetical protein
VQVVTLTGTGQERGAVHGRALAGDISDAALALRSHLRAAGHDPDALADRLSTGPLAAAAQEHLPDLWAETVAIGDTSGVGLADACLLSFLDEVWGLTRPGCSVLARRANAGTEIGQTMDLPAWTVGRLVVLRIRSEQGPDQLVMSYPGDLGLCGASTRLGIAVNALDQFGTDESGVGVSFILRHLLTLSTIDEVATFLPSVPHAAGQAYTVADHTGVATFEAGPGVFRRVTSPDASSCAHTNHPLDLAVREDRSTSIRLASILRSIDGGEAIEEALSGEVVLDGERYRDPNSTFAAFAYGIGDDHVRFADGIDLRAGAEPWTAVTFR